MSNGLALRASRWLARHAVRRRLPLNAPAGVVSFTFDDAPLSACTTGAGVLERLGARGTYYVAGGLTDGEELGRACHTEPVLRALLAAGHQLGCHSHSHVRVDTLDRAALRGEFDRNAAFLGALGVDLSRLDFAFPFGAYAWDARQEGARRFRSQRITGGGVQTGWADLDALKTHRLYRSAPDGVPFAERVAEAARGRGWLVVNTHDVEEDCSAYGCTPAELADAVALAQAAGLKVLPVGAAIDYWLSASSARA